MNRKFEQESTSYYTYMVYKQEVADPPQDARGLEDWADEVQESKWAIKSDEAHSKYMTGYQNQMAQQAHLDHVREAHTLGHMNNPKLAAQIDATLQDL